MLLRPEPSNFHECRSIVRGRIDSRARATALVHTALASAMWAFCRRLVASLRLCRRNDGDTLAEKEPP